MGMEIQKDITAPEWITTLARALTHHQIRFRSDTHIRIYIRQTDCRREIRLLLGCQHEYIYIHAEYPLNRTGVLRIASYRCTITPTLDTARRKNIYTNTTRRLRSDDIPYARLYDDYVCGSCVLRPKDWSIRVQCVWSTESEILQIFFLYIGVHQNRVAHTRAHECTQLCTAREWRDATRAVTYLTRRRAMVVSQSIG